MKPTKITLTTVLLVTMFSFGCNRSTRVEKETNIGPNGEVSQQTTVDKNVSTSVDTTNGVEVETKVNN